MVNRKRVKDKIPELLSDGPLNEYGNFQAYQKRRRQMSKIQRRNPSILEGVTSEIERALKRLDKWMEEEH